MDGENDPLNLHNEDSSADRFRKIREELEAMELPDLPGEEEIHERMPLLKGSRSQDRFPEAPQVTIMRRNPALNSEEDQGGQRSLGRGIAAGYTLLGAVVGAGLIGWVINHSIGLAVGAVVGAFLGLAFCIRLLNQP